MYWKLKGFEPDCLDTHLAMRQTFRWSLSILANRNCCPKEKVKAPERAPKGQDESHPAGKTLSKAWDSVSAMLESWREDTLQSLRNRRARCISLHNKTPMARKRKYEPGTASHEAKSWGNGASLPGGEYALADEGILESMRGTWR